MSRDRSPSAIEHELTRDILRGRYAVGSRLPTVRELARLHQVNPATIQRVVARLETRGLVTARQGSGLRVNDPTEVGDVALVPYWLEASLDRPAQAVAMLADLLELRRVVAVRLIVRRRREILDRAPELAEAARAVAAAAGSGIDAICQADLGFARALLRASGSMVALTVLNTVARVLEHIPAVAEAMYATPERNAAAMLRAMKLLGEDASGAGERIESILEEIDQATVERFARALEQRRAG